MQAVNVINNETTMTWDEFEQMLIDNGWAPDDAKAEREAQEHGTLGDCDGEL